MIGAYLALKKQQCRYEKRMTETLRRHQIEAEQLVLLYGPIRLKEYAERKKAYFNSLPRFKGKSIVPIVPLEKQKPAQP